MRLLRSRFVLAVCLLAFAAAPATLRAHAELPKKEITEKTSASFAELRRLTEAKSYPEALALIDRLLAGAPAGSYDIYVLSQVKTQILITQDKLADAIAPLEAALALAEGNSNFLDAPARFEQLQLLAQLHYQKAADQKSPEEQRAGYQRALAHLERGLEPTSNPSAQLRLFAASLHYQLATLGAAGEPDQADLRAAIEQCELGMRLEARPGAQLRQLLVACHLQLGDNVRASEHLELLAEQEPKNATTWSQLLALYLTMAGEAKDPRQAAACNVRALLTLDRAREHGFLASPKENYTRVAILFNLGQFVRAAELLEKGLADGELEPSQRNWELLASAYQQSDQEAKALEAYVRAVERFPAGADLEFALAQALYAAGKTDDAYACARSASGKPGLAKPGQARLYLAFLAYELRRIDDARAWLDQARATGEVPAASLDPLDRAVSDALKSRESLKNS